MEEGVWYDQDTTPSAIEAALREQLKLRRDEHAGYVPARVLNMVVIVDRDWLGEVKTRLDRVGRYHASRTIICSVEPRRDTLGARVTTSFEETGGLVLGHETVEVRLGERHLPGLDSVVDPLVVTDLATVVWSPHGHYAGVDALLGLSQVVLLDSVEEPDLRAALGRAVKYAGDAYVVDLAWLRSTPWRERVAATFDPPKWRPAAERISGLEVRHGPTSVVAALLFAGWLGSRLGWDPGGLIERDGVHEGRAHARKGDVKIRLEPDNALAVPGLSGLTLDMASGTRLSLDRGPGGLTAKRVARDGHESTWSVLGASRGEAGILGEGIRQALLRDPTYGPALSAAKTMVA